MKAGDKFVVTGKATDIEIIGLHFWHVIVKENSIGVVKKKTNDCKKVKGSHSCYTTRKAAVAQANTKELV